ncbi:SusE domain-containing protein [Dysgonomonas sp. 520]|uniref:SusE domain-containing protein n=1 Tax=Dysgonomonas sp. 520 TaxID=2302931 RepID=UPI0013D04BCD|nr:SusE domain-containing protein [Dysgonomonas sp. 520]NDW08451.1 hypothetical protein [Dysgonomonas sp. 520]
MRYIYIIFALAATLFTFTACEDDTDPKINASDTRITTNSIGIDKFEVDQRNLSDEAFNLTWDGELGELNVELSTTYVIQFDIAGNDFKDAKQLINTNEKSYSVISKDLNKFLITNFSQAYNTSQDYEFRVVAAVLGKDNILGVLPETATNYQTINITVIELKKVPLFIVGDGLVNWSNSAESIGQDLQLFFGDNNDGDQQYTYTASFKSGGIKLITQAGNWDTAYGLDGGKLVYGSGDNIPGPDAEGIYTLNVNLSSLTYELVEYTGEVTDYDAISLIGSAYIDWDTDLTMTKVANHVWVANNVTLQAGEFKFRANNGWSESWGAGSDTEMPFGIANGGDNFIIETGGTYYIAFNDITKHFVVIPTSELP